MAERHPNIWQKLAALPLLRWFFVIDHSKFPVNSEARILAVNALAFLGVSFSATYTAIYATLGWWLLTIVGVISTLSYLVTPWLNHQGRDRIASIYLSINALFWLTIIPAVFAGSKTGIHYFLFFIGPFTYIALRPEDRKLALFLVPCGILGIIATHFSWFPQDWVQAMPAGWSSFFYTLSVTSTTALLTLMVALFILQIQKTQAALEEEHDRARGLLINILPEPIADRLKNRQTTIADAFSDASVLFADIVGFTELAEKITPDKLVQTLNEYFSEYDDLVDEMGAEKIKTIGDAYMVAAGVPSACPNHALTLTKLALRMLEATTRINERLGLQLQLRIGINSGPVVAGVMGKRKFIYDLWGDTVNVAARMESHGVPGRIHLTDLTFRHICGEYDVAPRGDIAVKGKGRIRTWLIVSHGDQGMSRFGETQEPSIQWFPGPNA